MATPDADTQTADKPVVVNQTNVEGQPDFSDVAELLPVVVQESKAGWKTSEFWLSIALSLAVWLDGIPLPEKYEGIVIPALGLVYILSRGIAKAGVPSVVGNAK